jgi:hypothetical protein
MSALIERLEDAIRELTRFKCLPTCSKSLIIIQDAIEQAHRIQNGLHHDKDSDTPL